MRILVLDDNEDVRESMRLLLVTGGHDAVSSADAQEALELQKRQPVDLLITDIFMPGVDGLETIVAFRSRWPGLKIVAISGGGVRAKRDYLGVAGEIGADVVMRKPVDAQELLATVRKLAG
jgi:DNA-binding response OmpR family regulator